MQIISKFHDYYDVVQREGQDRSLAFVRQAQRFTGIRRNLGAVPQPLREFTRFAQEHSPGKVWYKEGSRTFSFTEIGFGLVLFAGKLYPCAEIKRERHDLAPVPKTFTYSHDSLLTFALEHGIEFDKKGRPKGMHRWRSDVWGSPKLRMFFELAGDVRFLDMTTVEPLPIVSWSSDSGTLEISPRLVEFEFYRVVSAWQAFQELSMFLGNIAAPDRVPITVADKDRIAKHGFDKWSFRKMPSRARSPAKKPDAS